MCVWKSCRQKWIPSGGVHGGREPRPALSAQRSSQQSGEFCAACELTAHVFKAVGGRGRVSEAERRGDWRVEREWRGFVDGRGHGSADEAGHRGGGVGGRWVAATEAERTKEAKYRNLLLTTEPRPTFVPLAWETGGRWGDKATHFFREAVERMGGSRSEKTFLSYWMCRFSVRFVKAVVDVRRRRKARFYRTVVLSVSRAPAFVFDAFFAEQDASPFPVRGDP